MGVFLPTRYNWEGIFSFGKGWLEKFEKINLTIVFTYVLAMFQNATQNVKNRLTFNNSKQSRLHYTVVSALLREIRE